jgi:hypothetical protein
MKMPESIRRAKAPRRCAAGEDRSRAPEEASRAAPALSSALGERLGGPGDLSGAAGVEFPVARHRPRDREEQVAVALDAS